MSRIGKVNNKLSCFKIKLKRLPFQNNLSFYLSVTLTKRANQQQQYSYSQSQLMILFLFYVLCFLLLLLVSFKFKALTFRLQALLLFRAQLCTTLFLFKLSSSISFCSSMSQFSLGRLFYTDKFFNQQSVFLCSKSSSTLNEAINGMRYVPGDRKFSISVTEIEWPIEFLQSNT